MDQDTPDRCLTTARGRRDMGSRSPWQLRGVVHLAPVDVCSPFVPVVRAGSGHDRHAAPGTAASGKPRTIQLTGTGHGRCWVRCDPAVDPGRVAHEQPSRKRGRPARGRPAESGSSGGRAGRDGSAGRWAHRSVRRPNWPLGSDSRHPLHVLTSSPCPCARSRTACAPLSMPQGRRPLSTADHRTRPVHLARSEHDLDARRQVVPRPAAWLQSLRSCELQRGPATTTGPRG